MTYVLSSEDTTRWAANGEAATEGAVERARHAVSAERPIRQLSKGGILAAWAAATVPMGLAAWVVAPAIADSLGEDGFFKALLATLTVGLIWQFVLVVGLVGFEQRSLRWATMRRALWLQTPESPSGRRGGRLWLLVVPALLVISLTEFIPTLPHSDDRNFGTILETEAGQSFFSGNWTWFAVSVALFVFNTMLGEELFFRGYLLPRMEGAFGQKAWLANGILFAGYHVHVPWVMPAVLILGTPAFAYLSQRYRSAWLGIIVHSAQTVVLTGLLLSLVLR